MNIPKIVGLSLYAFDIQLEFFDIHMKQAGLPSTIHGTARPGATYGTGTYN